eukprot:CAMPEP_0177635964 /NCGR_PEP_ID=MMETSP0447-20121125/4184_1 /TAXON_ID=0 /ORGANISM="Stygamoeba regulata, Strain BSH-02190019" /LENGTH=199 /DNA_ID=CAMNT_0019137791 /DNA_START=357 /DNA_END=956 /DNA_ORIENTATION=+
MKHNNVIPNAHFHKHWQERVRCYFNQAPQKKTRRVKRAAKAKAVFPRPVSGLLRPVVHCQTVKYNSKTRLGRGFTFEELKAAGINKREALNIGISVDHRRRNKSEESLRVNKERLEAYKAKLVVFPAPASEAVAQHKSHTIMPIVKAAPATEYRAITEEERKASVFTKLRHARSYARLVGYRQKRAAEQSEKKSAPGRR